MPDESLDFLTYSYSANLCRYVMSWDGIYRRPRVSQKQNKTMHRVPTTNGDTMTKLCWKTIRRMEFGRSFVEISSYDNQKLSQM